MAQTGLPRKKICSLCLFSVQNRDSIALVCNYIFFFQNLIYSEDDVIPLHYDSTVTDRDGQRHGITSMILFGSIYRFHLTWSEKSFRYFHNFTISVSPYDDKYIYSHTCLIASVNATESADLNKELLKKNLKAQTFLQLPINAVYQDSSYIDLDAVSQSAAFNFDSSHMTESSSQSENDGCGLDSHGCDQNSLNGELKYLKLKNRQFSVMSYNIWNMNPKSEEGDSKEYVKRMKLLKKVKI